MKILKEITAAILVVAGVLVGILMIAPNGIGDLGFLLEVVAWIALMGAIGSAIGKLRGQPGVGAVASIFLGPLAWLLILVSRDMRPKCPDCLGAVPIGAKKCMHCGCQLWTTSETTVKSGIELKCPRCGEGGFVNSGRDENEVECPACKHLFKIVEGKLQIYAHQDKKAEKRWREKVAGVKRI